MIALAELGAAVRWLHPSDQAQQLEWEPLLLAGIRSLESAGSGVELVEGLRGLIGEVAPTVVIWRRAGEEQTTEQLDALACPDPTLAGDEPVEPEPAEKVEPEPAEPPEPKVEPEPAEPAEPKVEPEPDTSSRARSPEGTKVREPDERETPARTVPGEPSESSADPEGESSTAEPSEPTEPVEGETPESETPETAKPEPAKPGKPEAEQSEPGEPQPPLPDALFESDEAHAITQWSRRGYADGLDDPGCAERIQHDPGGGQRCVASSKRRRRAERACVTCLPSVADPLTPAAPLRLELPRGVASLIPLALWSRAGQTLPATPTQALAPSFGEREAFDYTIEDRGTRLLAVLRTWSLVRRFFPRFAANSANSDLRARLIPALCEVADDGSPERLRASLETLLASLGDGNAAVLPEPHRRARRWAPELVLAWVEERVVVARSSVEAVVPGDVVRSIDGISIDSWLAERLVRTPAATASAAIVRTVAQLVERDQKQAAIELGLVRLSDGLDREQTVRVTADRRADRLEPADPRPDQAIVKLADGTVYLDATRVGSLAHAARRLRDAARVIVDLRGELADRGGSLLGNFISAPRVIATERAPTGPDASGTLPLELLAERQIEPARRRLDAELIVLADARTRGRAELELLGFEQLGARVVGSASAGDLGELATAWLPGGWQLRFTHTELRRPDGAALYGLGVRPTDPVEPTRADLIARADTLLRAAQA